MDPAWLTALEARHLANLTRQEFTRAVRALSARYVERRSQLPDRSPLDSAGKRAAFALYYAPLHFIAAQVALEHVGARIDLKAILDLGCGTGVCGAAWALMHNTPHTVPPALSGVDSSAWAVDEARWNWRTLGLRGQATRGDMVTAARGLLRHKREALAATGIIAGWTVNELVKQERDELFEILNELLDHGATLVVMEPLARGVAPWFEDWAGRLAAHKATATDVKADVQLPELLATFSNAAGFRKKDVGVRVLCAPGL